MAYSSFVALGDSFTEGLDDRTFDGGGLRGWADRFAERLAVAQPGLRYANLAVRGKLVGQVAREQVPAAISMRPDLAGISVTWPTCGRCELSVTRAPGARTGCTSLGRGIAGWPCWPAK